MDIRYFFTIITVYGRDTNTSIRNREEQLAISARHGGRGSGQLRLRFREKIDQALPRLRGVAVELQQFLIVLDVQFDDPWIFHRL